MELCSKISQPSKNIKKKKVKSSYFLRLNLGQEMTLFLVFFLKKSCLLVAIFFICHSLWKQTFYSWSYRSYMYLFSILPLRHHSKFIKSKINIGIIFLFITLEKACFSLFYNLKQRSQSFCPFRSFFSEMSHFLNHFQ